MSQLLDSPGNSGASDYQKSPPEARLQKERHMGRTESITRSSKYERAYNCKKARGEMDFYISEPFLFYH